MLVTTTFAVEGYKVVNYLGIVRGIVVRSPTIGQGCLGGLIGIFGGHNAAYTEMCEQTRQDAYDYMVRHAKEMGANAVIGFHYDATEVVSQSSATEVLAYGTAVVLQEIT
ncbi:MAG: YbjQ family protein [bacterium]